MVILLTKATLKANTTVVHGDQIAAATITGTTWEPIGNLIVKIVSDNGQDYWVGSHQRLYRASPELIEALKGKEGTTGWNETLLLDPDFSRWYTELIIEESGREVVIYPMLYSSVMNDIS